MSGYGEHVVREGGVNSDGSYHFKETKWSFSFSGATGTFMVIGGAVIVGGVALLALGPAGAPVAAAAAKGAATKVAAGAALKCGCGAVKAGALVLA